MQVTWWEWDELVEHMNGRPDIWHKADDGSWLRMSGENICFVMTPVQPEGMSPFRMVTLHFGSVTWEPEHIAQYVTDVFLSWTSMAPRLEAQQVLTEELNHAPEEARLGAIILSHVYNIGPVLNERPTRHDGEDAPRPEFAKRYLGQWRLQNGGWIRLHVIQSNGALEASLWFPAPRERHHGEIWLKGLLTSPEYPVSHLAHYIYGDPLPEEVPDVID